ncbi:MAG: hypothetical protein ABWK15_00285 [Dissulfuribacterales bacterium]
MWSDIDPVSLILWFQFFLDVILLALLCVIFLRIRHITPQKIDAFIVSLREMDALCNELDANLQEKRKLVSALREELTGLKPVTAKTKTEHSLQQDILQPGRGQTVSPVSGRIEREKDGVVISLGRGNARKNEARQQFMKSVVNVNTQPQQTAAADRSEQDSRTMVISMWHSGSDIPEIARATGLSLGEVELILSITGNLDENRR